jgi:hypothetical protein
LYAGEGQLNPLFFNDRSGPCGIRLGDYAALADR